MTRLLEQAAMPTTITHYGVNESNLQSLAEMAAKQWTAQFNPRVPTVEDFVSLYRAAL